MSITRIIDIAGSALRAQSTRLNAVASNLANAETAAAPGEAPYRAKQVVFSAEAIKAADGTAPGANAAAGVKVAEVREDQSPARRQYDPNHPFADAEGYVTLNNVNAVDEMVNMISASRSYQNNAEVINTAKTLISKTLQMGS